MQTKTRPRQGGRSPAGQPVPRSALWPGSQWLVGLWRGACAHSRSLQQVRLRWPVLRAGTRSTDERAGSLHVHHPNSVGPFRLTGAARSEHCPVTLWVVRTPRQPVRFGRWRRSSPLASATGPLAASALASTGHRLLPTWPVASDFLAGGGHRPVRGLWPVA